MKKKKKNICKYCGYETYNKDVCNRCKEKLKLVRILVKMGEPYRKVRVANGNN